MNKALNKTSDWPKRFITASEEDDSADGIGQAIARPERHKSSFATDLKWMASLALLMAAALTAPQWLWSLEHMNDPTTPVAVGAVQGIYFVGNLGVDSQIDTEEHSLLVRGVTRFTKGAVLEQRKSFWNLKICEVGTQQCEVRLGYR